MPMDFLYSAWKHAVASTEATTLYISANRNQKFTVRASIRIM